MATHEDMFTREDIELTLVLPRYITKESENMQHPPNCIVPAPNYINIIGEKHGAWSKSDENHMIWRIYQNGIPVWRIVIDMERIIWGKFNNPAKVLYFDNWVLISSFLFPNKCKNDVDELRRSLNIIITKRTAVD